MKEGFWSWLEGRSKVQFYVVFAFIWLCLHWQTWVALFFVSEKQIAEQYSGMLKLEYIKEYANIFIPADSQWSTNQKYWLNFAACLLVTAAVSYVAVWILPKLILLPAYKKERAHELAKRLVDEENEEEYLRKKKKTVAVEKQVATIQQETAVKRRATKQADESVLWDEEYEELKSGPLYAAFQGIIDAVYSHGGSIDDFDFVVPSNITSYADTNDLIEISDSGDRIKPTTKGKYFIKKYQAEKR